MSDSNCLKTPSIFIALHGIALLTILLTLVLINSDDPKAPRMITIFVPLSFVGAMTSICCLLIEFIYYPRCLLTLKEQTLKLPDASKYKWHGSYLSLPLSKIHSIDVGYTSGANYLRFSIDDTYCPKNQDMIFGTISYQKEKGVITFLIYPLRKKIAHQWKEKLINQALAIQSS